MPYRLVYFGSEAVRRASEIELGDSLSLILHFLLPSSQSRGDRDQDLLWGVHSALGLIEAILLSWYNLDCCLKTEFVRWTQKVWSCWTEVSSRTICTNRAFLQVLRRLRARLWMLLIRTRLDFWKIGCLLTTHKVFWVWLSQGSWMTFLTHRCLIYFHHTW